MPELGKSSAGSELARGGIGGATLADLYAAGSLDADQTLTLTNTSSPSGLGFVVDGSTGAYAGGNVMVIKTPGQTIVVTRSSGSFLATNGFAFGTSTTTSASLITNNTTRLSVAGDGITTLQSVSPTIASGAAAPLEAVQIGASSTVTITGTTEITTTTGFNFCSFKRPTFTSASPVQIDRAATVSIAGPPIQSNVTIGAGDGAVGWNTALWVQSTGTGINTILDGTTVCGANTNGPPANTPVLMVNHLVNAPIALENMVTILNCSANEPAPVAGTQWDGLTVPQSTLGLANGATTITALSMVTIVAPTIFQAATARTVTDAATVRITGAPVNGGGTISFTRSVALWVTGRVRMDGGVALGGGAAPTFGTIGGSGPATAAQNQWLPITVDGNTRFIPLWA